MKRTTPARRRPAVNISLPRASRLYRLVVLLAERPRDRDSLLDGLAIGLRTFYRELDLLKRCSIKVRRSERTYALETSGDEARGRLPFPDPQLNFQEMAELAKLAGPAASRLAGLLHSVVNPPTSRAKRGGRAKRD